MKLIKAAIELVNIFKHIINEDLLTKFTGLYSCAGNFRFCPSRIGTELVKIYIVLL